jgi:hypothetical protein
VLRIAGMFARATARIFQKERQRRKILVLSVAQAPGSGHIKTECCGVGYTALPAVRPRESLTLRRWCAARMRSVRVASA